MRGWVYIAKNESLVDMVKIGYTDRDPNIRLLELAGTGLPTPFTLLYSALVHDPERVEQEVHLELSGKRVSPDREFFRCRDDEAVRTITGVVNRLNLKIFYEEGGITEEEPNRPRRTSSEWRQYLINEYRICFRRLRKAARKANDFLAIESLVDQEIRATILIEKFINAVPSNKYVEDPDIDEHSIKALLERYFEKSGGILVNFRMVEVRSDKQLTYEYQQMVSKSERSSAENTLMNTRFICYFCKRPVKNSKSCDCSKT